MRIPLKEFEQHIDETILKRGYQYFKKGLVNEPELLSNGEYEVTVEGTEQYIVRLSIKHDIITECDCSCPYDMGAVCKHIVAVIFHLQQNELNLNLETNVKAKKVKGEIKKVKKKKTVAEQVDDLLEKLPHEDLKEYIKELCNSERSFRQLFLSNFAYLTTPDSQALYAKQIHTILKTSAGRGGYIGYSEARQAGNAIYAFVQRAEKFVEISNYRTAIYIACAVLEEVTDAITHYADDSNADFGGCIDSAFEVLSSIADIQPPEELRKELFNYCLTAYKKGKFKGWDWNFGILKLAVVLVDNTRESEQIEDLLDSIRPSGKEYDWDFEHSLEIRLELITKMEGDKAAEKFLEKNMSYSGFRKKVIEKAISRKEYQKAINLAEEGIELLGGSKPGYADVLYKYLLIVYIAQNNVENIIKYAGFLFLNSNQDKKEHFDILKQFVVQDEWKEFITRITVLLTPKTQWSDYSLLAQIYIWEEEWDKLLDTVKRYTSLQGLANYEEYLVKDYSDELSDLYKIGILEYMRRNMSRDHYQNACRYLRKMIKMGAREKANFVIEQLRTLYPKRSALMEELQKV
ncbi:MAG: SWIM zinc finger family protein [Ignavibacteriae bacterium]|nr:SWIM zinc finger family protein [Ignavibacteriota bacterium]